uniref:Uncharacterized protein n=1 Tax=Brassica oleracea TaxID=3712 RepID=A0A3P6D626_BRAOL|nr:unnamed protein product [Brassica oleracea]
MEANLVPLTPAFLQEVDAPLAPPTLVLVPGKRKLSQFRLRRPLASEDRSSYSSTLLTYVFLRGILSFFACVVSSMVFWERSRRGRWKLSGGLGVCDVQHFIRGFVAKD